MSSELVVGSDGTRLRVIRYGDGGGARFLLVHGLASNALLWDGVAARLARAGHTPVAVDQRGHGESDRPDHGYDFPTVAADLAAVVEGVFGEPVVVAGQSWGGNVVLELAARRPDLVRAVACVDGGFIQPSEQYPEWEEAARALAPPHLDGLTRRQLEERLAARFPGWPEGGRRGQLANFEDLPGGRVRPRLSRERHMLILRHLWEHRPLEVAPAVEAPVLVIAVERGDSARRALVERFAARLPHGRVVWVEGDHDVHAQQPGLVASLLLELAEGTG